MDMCGPVDKYVNWIVGKGDDGPRFILLAKAHIQ